jgi:hypothetical protein
VSEHKLPTRADVAIDPNPHLNLARDTDCISGECGARKIAAGPPLCW